VTRLRDELRATGERFTRKNDSLQIQLNNAQSEKSKLILQVSTIKRQLAGAKTQIDKLNENAAKLLQQFNSNVQNNLYQHKATITNLVNDHKLNLDKKEKELRAEHFQTLQQIDNQLVGLDDSVSNVLKRLNKLVDRIREDASGGDVGRGLGGGNKNKSDGGDRESGRGAGGGAGAGGSDTTLSRSEVMARSRRYLREDPDKSTDESTKQTKQTSLDPYSSDHTMGQPSQDKKVEGALKRKGRE